MRVSQCLKMARIVPIGFIALRIGRTGKTLARAPSSLLNIPPYLAAHALQALEEIFAL